MEAIVRLSEAIAKIHLAKEVNEDHINAAHILFTNSTLNAISSGKELGVEINQETQGRI